MDKNSNVIYDERIPRIRKQRIKPKANKLFLFLLFLFFFIVISVLYFQSPLAKLHEVEITGQQILTEEQILKGAHLRLGMSYYSFKKTQVIDHLQEMDEIKEVEVERLFPNRLNISISEFPVVAFWMEEQKVYPVLATGQILLNRPWSNKRIDRPILTNWPHKDGLIELSREMEQLDHFVKREISEISLTPITADPYRLTLYMINGFEVKTSIRKFAENMSWYPQLVEQVQADGIQEGTFYLLTSKWYEGPNTTNEEDDRKIN